MTSPRVGAERWPSPPQNPYPVGHMDSPYVKHQLLYWDSLSIVSLAGITPHSTPRFDRILRTACENAASWHGKGLGLNRVAVNFFPAQFQDPSFVAPIWNKSSPSPDCHPDSSSLRSTREKRRLCSRVRRCQERCDRAIDYAQEIASADHCAHAGHAA